jgi:hypothetical protein
MSSEEQDSVALAALLHDLGNVAVSDELLRKVGELNEEERSLVERHVLVGAAMAAQVAPDEVAHAIRHHHERWDGAGYPNALHGDAIPIAARIIGIAEAYDAMTSTRPYRQGLAPSAAIASLRAGAGSQFDPHLVEIFVSTLKIPSALFAPLQGQARELGLVLRRIGAVALSATASTIAIALILGSSVLSPGTFRRDPSAEVAQERNSTQGDDQVLGTQVSSDEGETSDAFDEDTTSDDDASDLGEGVDPATDGDPLTIAEGGSLVGPSIDFDDDEAPTGGGTDPEPQPEPEPPPPEPQPEPEPPPPSPQPEPEPEPEPQPEPEPEPTEPPSNGNGNGNGNSGEAPGNSGNAPGHNKPEGKP